MTTLAKLPGIILRPIEPGDVPFVLSSWLKSYSHGCRRSRRWPEAYKERHRTAVMKLIERCAVIVAAFDEDPETIMGWACCESNEKEAVLHYLYVRQEARHQGLAKFMIQPILDSGLPIVVSHWTTDAGELPKGWKQAFWRSYR